MRAATLGRLAALGVEDQDRHGRQPPRGGASSPPSVGLDPGAMLHRRADRRHDGRGAVAPRRDAPTLFVEVDPQQKERIVRALQHRGHAVGYLGDGINDAPALHAADVGISVDGAVDVARESADVRAAAARPGRAVPGRRAKAAAPSPTRSSTSASRPAPISATWSAWRWCAAAALPAAAGQADPAQQLPVRPAVDGDRVRPASTTGTGSPRAAWDVADLRRYMIVFGLVSTRLRPADLLVLLKVFGAGQPRVPDRLVRRLAADRTGGRCWCCARTGPAWRSRPGRLLWISTLRVAAFAGAAVDGARGHPLRADRDVAIAAGPRC